jgi:hypothetical protein
MNLKEIQTPELHKLISYLETLSERIRTGEVFWDFDVTLFEVNGSVSDVGQLIKSAYPDAMPERADISEASIEDVMETLNHELGRFLPEMDSLRMLTPVTSLHGEMWRYVGGCIDCSRAHFFEWFAKEKQDGLIGGILGEFAIIIYNEDIYRCLFLLGSTDAYA